MRQSRAFAGVFIYLAIAALLPGCVSPFKPELPIGTRLIPVQSDGQAREYWLHAPPASRDGPLPLVIVLHGTGSNGEEMLTLGDFVKHANKNDYVVAAPNALGRAFNEGSGRGGAEAKNIDDVAFVEQVIHEISKRADIAKGQVFVTGFSSGGAMAQRFALESDMNIAAVASVSGHLWAPERKPARARPLLLIFGDQDPLNPPQGGPVRYGPRLVLDKPAHRVTARQWAKRLGCATSVRATTEIVEHRSWHGCRNNVRLVYLTVKGLGHFWPGGPVKSYENLDASVTGPYQGKINATAIIWDFFMESATAASRQL